jgi:hypothetical protein
MKEKLERVIAALEVEAAMMESHAQRLLEMKPFPAGDEQRHEMLQLAKDEADRAEAMKIGITALIQTVRFLSVNRGREQPK